MTSAVFRTTLDMGSVQLGTVTARATRYQASPWAAPESLTNDPALLNGGTTADDFLAQLLADPEMADAMRQVRQEVGTAQAQHTGCGLAALRLQAGLSQKEQAQRMGKLQPAIARWERDPEAMTVRHVHQYCESLGITEQAFHDAIRTTQHQEAQI